MAYVDALPKRVMANGEIETVILLFRILMSRKEENWNTRTRYWRQQKKPDVQMPPKQNFYGE